MTKWHRFWQRFKFLYKKFFAIFFSCLGTAFLAGDIIYEIASGASSGSLSVLSFLSLILLLVAYFYLLYGNVTGTVVAYRGFLIFVFYVLWDFGTYLFISIFNGASSLMSGDSLAISLSLIYLVVAAASFVIGIMCYLRMHQFLTGRYAKYEMVRLWALLFMIACILVNGFSIAITALTFLSSSSIDAISIFLSLLEPISSVLMSIACFFTVLRLRSEY